MSAIPQTSESFPEQAGAANGRSFYIPNNVEELTLVELSQLVEPLGAKYIGPGGEVVDGHDVLPYGGLDLWSGDKIRITSGPSKVDDIDWTWSIIFNRPKERPEALVADVAYSGKETVAWQHVRLDEQWVMRGLAEVDDEGQWLARFIGRALRGSDLGSEEAFRALTDNKDEARRLHQEKLAGKMASLGDHYSQQAIPWRSIGYIGLGRLNSDLIAPMTSRTPKILVSQLPQLMRGFIYSEITPIFTTQTKTWPDK